MFNVFKHLFLLIGLLFILGGCLDFPPYKATAHYNQNYGPHGRNKLDIYLPQERDTSTETVMLIHGGAWVAGDKGGGELKDIRNDLLEAGYAVASMNYRYGCGDYHKQMEDVGNALSFIQSEAESWEIGDNRFALIGFSAGGHLALLYGHVFDTDDVVKAVISNVGPTDLTSPLFHQYFESYDAMWTLEQFLGPPFSADPALYAEASPLFHYSDCPSLFLYGGLDDLVPKEQGIAMFDTLIANGIAADTTIPAQGTHNVYGPSNMYKNLVHEDIISWLDLHLSH